MAEPLEAEIAVNIKKLSAGLAAAEARFTTASNRITGVTTQANKKMSDALAQSATGWSRLGNVSGATRFVLQNTANQVGDMAVQLSMGTNALRVMGQQIPQVLGGFGALGGSLGLLAPILGTVAALAFPIAAVFLSSGKAAGKASKDIRTLADDLGDLKKASDRAFAPASDLREDYGAGLAEARKLLEIERQRASIAAERAVTATIGTLDEGGFGQTAAALQEELNRLGRNVGGGDSGLTRLHNDASLLVASLGLAAEDVAILTGKIAALGDVEGAAAQANAIQDIINYTIEAAGGVENITGETALWFDSLLKIGDQVAQIAAQQEVNVARGQDLLASFQAQAEMAALIAKYGEDGAAVTLAKLEAEREVVAAKVEALGLSQQEADAILKAWDQANNLTDAVIAAAIATSDVVYGIGDITAAFDPAIVKAGELARAIAGARALSGMANPDPNAPFDAEGELAQARVRAGIFVAPARSSGGGRSGGGGGQSDSEKAFNDLLSERKKLLEDLKSPADKYAEALATIRTLQTTKDPNSGEFLITEEQANAAIKRLEKLKGTAFDVSGALKSAFEGIFDDPQQALEDLGKKLLEVALKMAAMKLLPNIFGGGGVIPLSLNAKGGVYSGRGISAHSNTVVSKPTIFPFARGAGLMGEAGPEAILPLTKIGGKLGVASSGGGGTDIQIIDQRGANSPPVETQKSRGPDGREMVRLIVSEEIGRGGFDGPMKSRYGNKTQKVKI